MKKILIAFLFIPFLGSGQINAPLIDNPTYKPGWNIVFQDEFNDSTLDSDLWYARSGDWGSHYDNPFWYVKNNAANIQIDNGTLKLKTIVDSGNYWNGTDGMNMPYRYTLPMLTSHTNNWGPGYYYEIRCKIPYGFLHHPGFWVWSCDSTWSEVDFYENGYCDNANQRILGTNTHYFICGDQEGPLPPLVDIEIDESLPMLKDAFYTVGVYWTNSYIDFYVNNHFAKRMTTNIPQEPGTIWLGSGLSTWLDNNNYSSSLANMTNLLNTMENSGEFPGVFEIDYIRIYERNCGVQNSISNYGVTQGFTSQNDRPRMMADVNGDGISDIVAFAWNYTLLSLGNTNGNFNSPIYCFADCTKEQGYTDQNNRPRFMADVNGDGRDDIVAFGYNWTTVNLGLATGGFGSKIYAIQNYTKEQGWDNQSTRPRYLRDVNGDGRDDIIGFGYNYTLVSLGQSNGTFGSPLYVINDYTVEQGFSNQDLRPRLIGDINGDGRADIVAFGWNYTTVNLGQANGYFGSKLYVQTDYTLEQGWTSQQIHPRLLADINGDGRDDIIGFGSQYVTTNFGKTNGTVGSKQYVMENFTVSQGWNTMEEFPRYVADVNGDCKADIIGFGGGETKIAISKAGWLVSSFDAYQNITTSFAKQGGWNYQNTHPRFVCDITGDGNNDIVGFGTNSVYSLNCINSTTNVCPNSVITNPRSQEEIESDELSFEIKMFPNPTNDKLTINLENESGTLQVFDLTGKLILTNNYSSKTFILDVHELNNGVYIIKNTSSNGATNFVKFVVQH